MSSPCPFCNSTNVEPLGNPEDIFSPEPNRFICMKCHAILFKDLSKLPAEKLKRAIAEGKLVVFNNHKNRVVACSINAPSRCEACEG